MKDANKKSTKKKRHDAVTFKPYVQDQAWLFPPSLGEMIPVDHKVRLINDAIDGMGLDPVLATYKGGGTSSYHPRMLLKALVYGYVEKIYSSRGIEQALKENICFMWLSGMQQPDHNTLNSFRKHRLNQTVKEVFAQVLLMLIEQGHVRMEDYHVDGTKMESVAGRYTYVWAKNVERYKSGLLDKIARLIAQIEQTNEQEEAGARPPSGEEALAAGQSRVSDSEAVRAAIERINEGLQTARGTEKEVKKKRRQLDELAKKHLPRLRRYEEQEDLLNGRSSYAKTDVDATFMRTKDDHLGSGQLRPCYNLQLGTEDQFILNYTVHQTASDMAVFTEHMDDTLSLLDQFDMAMPENAVADAGYGSEENYSYLESLGIEAYVKYPGFYKEQKGKFKKPFDQRTLHYNGEGDYWVCPMGQHLHKCGQTMEKAPHGKTRVVSHYEAANCERCPLKGVCSKAAGNRVIKVNHRARNYRRAARKRLESLKGIRKRRQRNIDVEAVFGHIKQDRRFRRFMLTSLEGVETETGLLAIAHNFIKWHLRRKAKGITMPKHEPRGPQMAQMTQQRAKTIRKVA